MSEGGEGGEREPVRPERVLVLVHAVRTSGEREVHTALLQRLRERGAAVSTIAWDRGMVFMDIEAVGPVREVEAINRWRLPQVLARVGLPPLARALRQGRVRAWWRSIGEEPAVLVLGRLRPELVHYVPPGAGPVGLVLGWREAEGAESLPVTLELADRVVTTGDPLEGAGEHPTFSALVADAPPAPRRAADEEVLVTGVGPGDWRGAPDLFLRMAAALPDHLDGRPVRFAWSGLDPEDGRSYPYLHDAEHLGLTDRLTWLVEPGDALAAVAASSAVVVTGRAPFPLGVHALLDAVGAEAFFARLDVPVLGFATPALEPLAGIPGLQRIPYPDTGALAAAVAEAAGRADPAPLAAVADPVLDHLVGR